MNSHWRTWPQPHIRGRFAQFAQTQADDPESTILLEQRGAVALITMNRYAKRNALDRRLSETVLEAVMRAGADTTVRAVVLAGVKGSFCAGDDLAALEEWRTGDGRRAPFDAITHDGQYLRLCEEMLHLAKPVVAAITGNAAGAGTDIACAADIRIAGQGVALGSRELQAGHVGNAVLLPRLVGIGRATQIYLSGRMVPAEEALAIGLVDEVVDDDLVVDVAMERAAQLATMATRAIGLYKELRERAWGQPVEFGMRLQDGYHIRTHDTVADSAEGTSALSRRQAPVFTGD